MAYLIDSWGQIDSIAEWDAAVAEATGVEVTSSVGTVSAIGGAAGTASGIELAAIAEAITAAGIANTQIGGTEAAISNGDAVGSGSANAQTTGAQVETSQSEITSTGTASAVTGGIQATASAASIGANGSGFVSATATVEGVEAVITAATITASEAVVEQPNTAAGKPRRRRPVIHPPNFLHDKPVNAVAHVYGVQAVAELGSVRPIGVSNYELNEGVQGQSEVARIGATGIQNPTDEEMALLLMA